MNNFLIKLFSIYLAISLVSCSTNTPRQNKALGATVGGATGAALGTASGPSPGAITLVGTGAIVGLLLGSTYGNPMENADKEKAYQAIAAGKTATWQNPSSKITYTVIPAANCITLNGNPHCRQFTAIQTLVDGSKRDIYRTACEEANGKWELYAS